MTRLGVIFQPRFPPERLRAVVEAADDAGLEDVWLWEDCFLESGIATAAAALAWTERLTVGIGVLPVPLRNVALTAMEVATLHRLFPGRVRIGIGHGVLDWMAQVGERVASPMTLLGEYVDALRRLLAGELVTVEGRYVHLDGVKLDWPPPRPVPILLAAIGPRTLQLAGAASDGTVFTGGTSPGQIAEALAHIEAGRRASERTDPHEVVVYVPAATAGAAGRLDRRDLGVVGDAPAVAEAIGRWAEAGAGTVALLPTADEPEAFVRFVVEEIRPLLRPTRNDLTNGRQ